MLPPIEDIQAAPGNTDHLALPFFAGLGAHFVLASDHPPVGEGEDPLDELKSDKNWKEMTAECRELLADCRSADDEWESDPARLELVRDLAIKSWTAIAPWMTTVYLHQTALAGNLGQMESRYETAGLRWVKGHVAAPLLDFAIAAATGVHVVTTEEDAFPILCRRSRPIRVEVANRLRRDGLTRWPAIIRALDDAWTGDAVARFAFAHAEAGHRHIDDVLRRFDLLEAQTETQARDAAEQARREALASLASAPPSMPVSEHNASIVAYEDRYRELSAKAAAAQRDRDAIAERDGKLRSRIEGLEERLAAALRRIAELEAERPSAPLSVPANVRVSGSGLSGDAREETVATEPDPQVFAGRRVLLYTGEANGEARSALARSFAAWGASDVTCYWADKERGPDIVPREALVVVDVRFMSHSTSEAILRMAERSGAWSCVTTRSAALIADEVAGRWKGGRGASPT